MSIKHYGIYLAYPPTTSLHKEGLGRHLAAFLKGAEKQRDVRFVIACPSWSKDSLFALCESEQINPESFDLVSIDTKPLLLRVYECYKSLKDKSIQKQRLKKYLIGLCHYAKRFQDHAIKKLVSTRNPFILIIFSIYFMPFFLFILIGLAGRALLVGATHISRAIKANFIKHKKVADAIEKVQMLEKEPKNVTLAYRLYQSMEKNEIELLMSKINQLSHVRAWYSPTAFWSSFNKINAPRLMCVPDVVLMDFPGGFSRIGSQRALDGYDDVINAIRGCDNFVVYSEYVKWQTLVNSCTVDPVNVRVIYHAPNRSDQSLFIDESASDQRSVMGYCKKLFRSALKKSYYSAYTKEFENTSVRFLFYASQFRPNKNVINLLKAYVYLLRKRFISHKLILTGHPTVMPDIEEFMNEHNLKNDVLCLRNITSAELAACYYLADLAINPSLSEGGCPFTFTEALSVNTPVVMARIPVTMEILNDASLQDTTFFDPCNWKDMANRIEWGIKNRDALLELQKPVYARLAERTWSDVVDEYIALLDEISLPAHLATAGAAAGNGAIDIAANVV